MNIIYVIDHDCIWTYTILYVVHIIKIISVKSIVSLSLKDKKQQSDKGYSDKDSSIVFYSGNNYFFETNLLIKDHLLKFTIESLSICLFTGDCTGIQLCKF